MSRRKSLPPEARAALQAAGAVLVGLWAAKAVAPLPYVGSAALTAAAYLQLYLPMRHCERAGLAYAAVGLTGAGAGRQLRVALGVACAVLPAYAMGLHVLLVHGHAALSALGLTELAGWVPRAQLAPSWPASAPAAWRAAGAGLEQAATHYLGVALPEETFYRGYLQPQLQRWMGPGRRLAGAPLGGAACLSCGLFALGHFLGEWQPLRLLPFFPGLLFAWLRGRSGGIVGCIWLHGTCNLASAALLALYRPL